MPDGSLSGFATSSPNAAEYGSTAPGNPAGTSAPRGHFPLNFEEPVWFGIMAGNSSAAIPSAASKTPTPRSASSPERRACPSYSFDQNRRGDPREGRLQRLQKRDSNSGRL